MMQAGQDRPGDDLTDGQNVVVRRRARAVRNGLTNPLMRSGSIEVVHLLSKNAPQVPLPEQQNVVKAFAPEAAEESLADRVHIGVETADDLDVGAAGDVVEPCAEFVVAVANQESRCCVEGGVAQLLSSPLLRGVVGYGLVDDLSRVVLDDDGFPQGQQSPSGRRG